MNHNGQFVVVCNTGNAPTHYHTDYQSALGEARRLAKMPINANKHFEIMKVLSNVHSKVSATIAVLDDTEPLF